MALNPNPYIASSSLELSAIQNRQTPQKSPYFIEKYMNKDVLTLELAQRL